ncbi:MAG: TonB-dependent receptor, partial [Opitutaceae bacterium]
AARAAESAPRRAYRIPAGDAAATLRLFVEQSGEQLLFLVRKVRDVRTHPVEGSFTARQALEQMVVNTSLTITQDEKSGALLIHRAGVADDAAQSLSPKPNRRATPEKTPAMSTPPRKLLSRLAAAFAVMVAPLATAQTSPEGTGVVQGRVFNPVSQEYVRNAEVRLEGTNQVTYTENDGSFRFNQVAAGPASLAVTYTGYNPMKETFTVTPGQATVREINLASTAGTMNRQGAIQLDTVNVSSEREGNSKAIMAQRRNMDITTSVSSDIFGEVTDGNVGEFLKYLPGVDLDYVESLARGPRLGGMDSQYVGVTFDGLRTASADSVRGGGDASRSTSFEGFSINAVDSIEISRTTSAESDADSPAGTINMKTKRAFDRKGRRLGFTASVNFNAEEFHLNATQGPSDSKHLKWRPTFSGEYSESFLNQRLGVLLSLSSANSYTEQYDIQTSYNRTPTVDDPRPMVIRQIDFKDGPKFMAKESALLTVDFKVTPNLVVSLNGIYSYAGGEFWNRSFTFIGANDNTNVANGRSTIGGDGMLTVSTNRSAANTVPTLNNGNTTSTEITYSRSFSSKVEYKIASWTIDGSIGYSRAANNFDALERGYLNGEGGGVPSNWVATRPHVGSWEWAIRQTSGPDWYEQRNFVDTNTRSGGTRVNNDDRTWITTLKSAQLNARWALPMKWLPTVLRAGGKWGQESRDNNNRTDWNIWSYIGPGGNTTTVNPITGANQNVTFGHWANVGPQYVSPHRFDTGTTNGLTVFNINGVQGMPDRVNRNAVADLFHTRPEMFVHNGTPENFYTAFISNRRDLRQTVNAGYLQSDTRITPKLQMRIGVRMEETVNELTEFDPLLRAQVIAAGYAVNPTTTNSGRALTIEGMKYQYMSQPRITRESKYHNYFPSLLFKYQILPNFEFQAGANKAISRPPVDSLTGLWNVDETNLRVNAPNAKLEPEHSKNYQSRLAYYFAGRSPGQLSLAVSQNNIRNLRESFDFSASEFGVDDPDFASYTFRTTRNSAETRRFRNMEVSYNQTLGFLGHEALRGINLNLAYSRSYASQRRNNLAPHRLTSRLGYTYRRFNGSLGMVHRAEAPDGAYGLYYGKLTQFDTTLNWRLTKQLSLYVQGRNITGVPILRYASPIGVKEGEQAAVRRLNEYGANWVFGVRGTF